MSQHTVIIADKSFTFDTDKWTNEVINHLISLGLNNLMQQRYQTATRGKTFSEADKSEKFKQCALKIQAYTKVKTTTQIKLS